MTQQTQSKLLIIEDDQGLQRQLRWALDPIEVVFAEDHDSALAQLHRHDAAVATLDLGLPPDSETPSEGFRTLQDMLALAPALKVIALTARNDRANAVRSIGMGAIDFLSKPFEPHKLRVMIERAFRMAELERERWHLNEIQTNEPLPGLITCDPGLMQLARQAARLAPLTAGVLLTGESGTGKELFARALHDMSPRRSKRFVAINCAAIPEALLESELFGHERGAFTGANRQTQGKVHLADGGTLFLDEVGDMPLSLQPKLLRFLQERVVERIGSRDGTHVQVRVVCATHRDLSQMMAKGTFRQDLFYRISEIGLAIPPLRMRPGDAVALAHTFVRRFAAEYHHERLLLSDDAIKGIESHTWPGNVRELENCVRRATIFAENGMIHARDLGLADTRQALSLNLRQSRDEFEIKTVLRALARVEGNISKAAELLGISRPTIYELLNRHGLRDDRSAH